MLTAYPDQTDLVSRVLAVEDMELPVVRPGSPRIDPSTESRILLVEDNLDTQRILKKQLTLNDYQVVGVEKGVEALAWLGAHVADLILLDLMLPDIDGLEVCRRVREQYAASRLPILMLTSLGGEAQDRVAGLDVGANDIMAKPYHLDELLARIDSLLKTSLRRHNHELQVSNQISKIVTSTLDLNAILNEVIQVVCETIEATSAYVCDVDFQANTTTVLAEYFGPGASQSEIVSDLGVTYSLDEDCPSLAKWLHNADDRYVSHVDDPDLDVKERAELEKYGGKSTLTVPLIAEEQIFGYIELWESRRKRQFTEDEIQLVQAIADQIAMAIVNAKLHARLWESETAARDLLDNAYDLIQRIGPDGRFTYVNYSWLRTMGYAPNEVIQASAEEFLRPDQIGTYQHALQQLQAGEEVTDSELVMVTKSGDEVVVEANFTPRMEQGQLISIRGILRDISERKRAEQQHRALLREQERMHVLQRFISDASHDLKTPLSTAMLSLGLLKRVSDAEKREKHLAVLDERLEHLANLVDDMLTMSRLDQTDPLVLEAVDLNALVRIVVASLEAQLSHHQHQLILRLDEQISNVKADPAQFQRALSNLVENAVVYTPDCGTIIIRTTRQGQQTVIEVQDNGPGIDEADLPYIFDRFYRVDKARNATLGGTGLGLAITKSIIEAHGGTIQVDSTLGQGSTFRISLPLPSAADVSTD